MRGAPMEPRFFESDPVAMAWFEEVFDSAAAGVRVAALKMLSRIDSPIKSAVLARACHDPDPRVSQLAVELIETSQRSQGFDLFEADFATGDLSADLDWQWEYHVAVPHGLSAPLGQVRIWLTSGCDADARRLAVIKAYAGKEAQARVAVPIIVGKRLVNRYTRPPRSAAEARQWQREGRPVYRDE